MCSLAVWCLRTILWLAVGGCLMLSAAAAAAASMSAHVSHVNTELRRPCRPAA